MAWSTPGTAVTGATATAVFWNANVRDNLAALNPLDSVGATSWAATLKATTTDPTISATTGRYWRVGPLVYVWAKFTFGSSGGFENGSGTYYVELPIESSGLAVTTVIGSWFGNDSGTTSNNEVGSVTLNTATPDQARFQVAGGSVDSTTPFIWASGDVLSFHSAYPAA